jgi:hypothetical protein
MTQERLGLKSLSALRFPAGRPCQSIAMTHVLMKDFLLFPLCGLMFGRAGLGRRPPSRGSREPTRNRAVFINCPFDAEYRPLMRACCIAIMACGYLPRCALDTVSRLPRFNMPLELGADLGLRLAGPALQRQRKTLILDAVSHRYDKTLSDISGIDIGVRRRPRDLAEDRTGNQRGTSPGPSRRPAARGLSLCRRNRPAPHRSRARRQAFIGTIPDRHRRPPARCRGWGLG